MNIIIDTNLWISFLIGKKLSILKALLAHPDLKIYVCDELVEEFKDVASRDKIRKYISEQDIIDSLKIIDLYCCYCSVKRMAISPVRDAKDLYLLSLADSISADYLVTGDKDLLVLQRHNKTKIVTYSELKSILK